MQDRQGAEDSRWALRVSQHGDPGFSRLGSETTKVSFTNHLSDTNAAENQIRLSGSGVALGDVDGDGWCDMYLCGLQGPNALFRNVGGWKFEEITASSPGLNCAAQYSTAALLGDVDGDGDLDLLVNGLGTGTKLWFNNGNGRFTEAPESGLMRRYGAMSMALGDLDSDGDLDLYVANYRTTTVRSTGLPMLVVDGKRMLRPEDRDEMYITPEGFLREHGEPDLVYLNNGTGRFTPVSWDQGMFLDERGRPFPEPPRGWGFSVMIRDFTGDGHPDIYVCNDFWSPDWFWVGNGQGTYRLIQREALAQTSSFSMGVDGADINRDGHDDFFVLDMLSPVQERRMRQASLVGLTPPPYGYPEERLQVERNTLFLNRGDGTFAEIAQLSGVAATEWSWCPVFLDVDLDGYEDLLISNGYGFDTQDMDADARIAALGPLPRSKIPGKLLMYPRLPLTNFAFRNRGDLTFENKTQDWSFDQEGYSHGMALGDLDNDGDLDVVINNMNEEVGIYRNNASASRVAVVLRGPPGNREGIGARIEVSGGPVVQSQEIIAGGRYLSCDQAMRVFAVQEAPVDIKVRWRDGKVSTAANVEPNHRVLVNHPGKTSGKARGDAPHRSESEEKNSGRRWFREMTSWPGYSHHEDPFDDFSRQPLLYRRLSQSGPGLAWFDWNGDGWDDLAIGSGRGGKPATFKNDGRVGFTRWETVFSENTAIRDQTAILGWRSGAGTNWLGAGLSNYEDGSFLGAPWALYEIGGTTIQDNFRGQISSTGPLALGDMNGDGDLDLFLGGRCVPGRYPEHARSMLFQFSQGEWTLNAEASRTFQEIGLVNAAVWSDLDGDGYPELILACEWGPLRIFKNREGHLEETTRSLGMDVWTGWWNSVATGDFDGNGHPDLLAGNWGKNTPFQPHMHHPLRIYFGDLDDNGVVEGLQAHYDPAREEWVPERSLSALSRAWPAIQTRFTSHEAYGKADVKSILGTHYNNSKMLEARTLETTLFLNRKSHFEIQPLPVEAQFAPVFGIVVADFNGDGHEDAFLAQNVFGVEPKTSPYTAGRGLLLAGDGTGNLEPIPGQVSGIQIYGEQRGSAASDFNKDGKVDLAVTQNSGPTMLYTNATSASGLRVALEHLTPQRPVFGAALRTITPRGKGPLKEIQAGSGYASQSSPVQVLHPREAIEGLEVRWPGGRITQHSVPTGTSELVIRPPQ